MAEPIVDILGDVVTDYSADPITTLTDYVMDASLRAFLTSGVGASMFRPGVAYSLVASPGVVSITGLPVTIVRAYVPGNPIAEFTISGNAAEMLAVGVTPLLLYANSGELSVEGFLTFQEAVRLLILETESHNTSGLDTILIKNAALLAEIGEVEITGTAVVASSTVSIEALEGAVGVVGKSATLTLTTVWDLFAAPGSYFLSGTSISETSPKELNAAGRSYIVRGFTLYFIKTPGIPQSNRHYLKDVTPRRNIKVLDSGRKTKDATPLRILEIV